MPIPIIKYCLDTGTFGKAQSFRGRGAAIAAIGSQFVFRLELIHIKLSDCDGLF